MDWLRSEDLKEEKNVTASKVYYSSPSAVSLPKVTAYHWGYRNESRILSSYPL